MIDELTIERISWERVILTFVVRFYGDAPDTFFLTPNSRPYEVELPVRSEPLGEGRYRLTINVTQFNRRGQVPNGTYFLIARRGEEVYPASYPLRRAEELGDASRAFVYNKNFSAYTVTFGVSDDESAPYFLMRTYSFGRSSKKPSSGVARLKSKARKKWKNAKRKALRSVFAISAFRRPSDGSNILFASEARPNMQGNLKAVHDRMLERGLDSQFNFGYSFRTGRTSSRQSAFALAWEMGKANTILIDDYFAILRDLGNRDEIGRAHV